MGPEQLQPQAGHHHRLDGVLVDVGRDPGSLAVLGLNEPVEEGSTLCHQRPELADVPEDEGDPLGGGVDPDEEPRPQRLEVPLELD